MTTRSTAPGKIGRGVRGGRCRGAKTRWILVMAGLVPAIQPWFGGFSQDADARVSIGRCPVRRSVEEKKAGADVGQNVDTYPERNLAWRRHYWRYYRPPRAAGTSCPLSTRKASLLFVVVVMRLPQKSNGQCETLSWPQRASRNSGCVKNEDLSIT